MQLFSFRHTNKQGLMVFTANFCRMYMGGMVKNAASMALFLREKDILIQRQL